MSNSTSSNATNITVRLQEKLKRCTWVNVLVVPYTVITSNIGESSLEKKEWIQDYRNGCECEELFKGVYIMWNIL